MCTDEILNVRRVTRDGGTYAVRCPHCKDIIAIEGDDLSEIQSEQYKCRCGGWLTVAHNAQYVSTL